MFHDFKLIRFITFLVCFLGSFCTHVSAALHNYTINPKKSFVEGKINYSVVGQYHATLGDYQGEIKWDPQRLDKASVDMTFFIDGLQSKYRRLDRIVKSARLLDTATFPTVTFKSRSIHRLHDDQYLVEGVLTIKGVQRIMTYPFTLDVSSQGNNQTLKASGQWIVNRKDFDILWHHVLDKGGFIVGNHLTIDWHMTAQSR